MLFLRAGKKAGWHRDFRILGLGDLPPNSSYDNVEAPADSAGPGKAGDQSRQSVHVSTKPSLVRRRGEEQIAIAPSPLHGCFSSSEATRGPPS